MLPEHNCSSFHPTSCLLCYALPSFQAGPTISPTSSPASCATCAFSSQPLVFLPPIHQSVHVFFHLLPIFPCSRSRHYPWVSFFPTVHPLSSVPYPSFHAAQRDSRTGSSRETQEATPRGRSGCVRWNLRNLGRVSDLDSGAHQEVTGGLPTFSPAWIFRDTPCTAIGSSGRCLSPKSRNSICPPQGQRG